MRGWQRVCTLSIIENWRMNEKSNKTADKNIKLHHVTAEMEQREQEEKVHNEIRHFGASEAILLSRLYNRRRFLRLVQFLHIFRRSEQLKALKFSRQYFIELS